MVDVELYGGRGGFLKHIWARACYALGAYERERDIDWASIARLVFVCKGNICRSPYACARARSLGAHAASFGLDAADGGPADSAALANALVRGMDLSAHRSARIEPIRVTALDLVIVFEPAQISEFRRRIGIRTRVRLLGTWTRPVRPHIQDPYGRSDRYFQECFSAIDANVAALVSRLTKVGAPAVKDQSTQNMGRRDDKESLTERRV